MDNLNITMEEYIRLEEEKARWHGKVYNWETAKYDFLTELTLCPQHIDEFDLKDETSLSEYDEVEQNILYFNDLFPFNIIHPDDLKSGKDNDDNKIDIIQSLKDMALPPRDQRHQYHRFGGNEATKKTWKTLLSKCMRTLVLQAQKSLDSIFNRLQKIRNKPDLDTMSFDDLYNNFKIVEQEVKGTASSRSSSSSQNMAFVSSPSSTNEVNTACGVSTANTQVSTASTQVSTANLSDDTFYAFLASQPNWSQLVYEDLEYNNLIIFINLFYYDHNCSGKFFALLHYLHC
ncbi:hypothetical protein Tco_0200669 [Tanacetum coccineum]